MRNLLIMTIGVPELKSDIKSRKDSIAVVMEPLVEAFFDTRDPIVARSEIVFDRIKISKSSALCQSRDFIEFVESIRKQFSVQHIAIYLGQELLVCSNAYFCLHPTDKQLLYILKENLILKAQDGFAEMIVYPTHTSLTDDIKSIGSVAFRYIVMLMPCGL